LKVTPLLSKAMSRLLEMAMLTTAGLWDEWTSEETGETIRSCTMIITEPNVFVAEVHDRMPVLLRPEQLDS